MLRPIEERRKRFILRQLMERDSEMTSGNAATLSSADGQVAVLDKAEDESTSTSTSAELRCYGGRVWKRRGWFERTSHKCGKRAICGQENCTLL